VLHVHHGDRRSKDGGRRSPTHLQAQQHEADSGARKAVSIRAVLRHIMMIAAQRMACGATPTSRTHSHEAADSSANNIVDRTVAAAQRWPHWCGLI
jgi:hypothetical protein